VWRRCCGVRRASCVPGGARDFRCASQAKGADSALTLKGLVAALDARDFTARVRQFRFFEAAADHTNANNDAQQYGQFCASVAAGAAWNIQIAVVRVHLTFELRERELFPGDLQRASSVTMCCNCDSLPSAAISATSEASARPRNHFIQGFDQIAPVARALCPAPCARLGIVPNGRGLRAQRSKFSQAIMFVIVKSKITPNGSEAARGL